MIGIDIGNQSSFVAVVKDCGVETVDNDYSLRATSSVVAFSSRNRILGVAAANQQTSNLTNTISSFKPLLGLRWEDFFVLDEVQRVPYKLVPHPSGGVAVQVCYFGEERVYSMEHITAMLLTGLKVTTETVLKSVIKNCVMAYRKEAMMKAHTSLLRRNQRMICYLVFVLYCLPFCQKVSGICIFLWQSDLDNPNILQERCLLY
ncbi:heat shock protein 105 kDa-like [Folsomia candida]|uniref:heat shock protein 105 kDa-like n=1 Tax=Folsomia candida TaxID=158441 RepID=UPI0016053C34|nr:heat shock protein 105 kDa-like [Folsomia candida]